MSKKRTIVDNRPPVMIPAGLFDDLVGVVNAHYEMSEAYLRGGRSPERHLKGQKAVAKEFLRILRPLQVPVSSD